MIFVVIPIQLCSNDIGDRYLGTSSRPRYLCFDTTITCDALASDPASLGMPHYTDNCSDSVLVANTISFRDDSTGF
ncbi:MAG: hypothetical protein IPP42_24840 [Saprospiraceae bacterium]|nr:hypothetical protein [Saprospiraceae bacterium]